jgi:hypothetical protein
MDPHILYPVDPRAPLIVMTDEELAELDRKWEEAYTPDFCLRSTPELEAARAGSKDRLRARLAEHEKRPRRRKK